MAFFDWLTGRAKKRKAEERMADLTRQREDLVRQMGDLARQMGQETPEESAFKSYLASRYNVPGEELISGLGPVSKEYGARMLEFAQDPTQFYTSGIENAWRSILEDVGGRRGFTGGIMSDYGRRAAIMEAVQREQERRANLGMAGAYSSRAGTESALARGEYGGYLGDIASRRMAGLQSGIAGLQSQMPLAQYQYEQAGALPRALGTLSGSLGGQALANYFEAKYSPTAPTKGTTNISGGGWGEFEKERTGDGDGEDDWMKYAELGAKVAPYAISMFSSITLKENVKDIDNALEKIEKMRGVKFDWKATNDADGGVIAEELEQIIPEAVTEINGIKAIKPMMIIAYLIEAIKELNEKIKAN